MIVLHAIWDYHISGRLHLWAETADLPAGVGGRAARSAKRGIERHPFALDAAALREPVGELAGSLLAASATCETLTLSLPSGAKGPLPSPHLLLTREDVEVRASGLRHWQVPTLALDAGDALDFLLVLPTAPPHHTAFGDALRFWTTTAQFAFELLARQCFFPALHEAREDGAKFFRAVWEAWLSAEDAERLATLAEQMPPLCRAFLPPEAQKASLPREIVRHFLDQTIDAFVRGRLAPAPLTLPRRDRSSETLSPAAQWLRALSSADPQLAGDEAELEHFGASLRSWLDQLRPATPGAPFRTCFRLDAPDGDEHGPDSWRVSFHLQANDDKSLLVPAERVWKERSRTLTFLKRKFENPQERLLADLGKASRLFPLLEEGLRAARPRELKLTTEQAYAFLRQSAPLLEQSGFGVLVPPWWQKPTARLGIKLKVRPKGGANASSAGLLGMDGLAAYDWSAAVGDTELSPQEFEQLVKLKVPLVRVRGQWVELRPEEIEAAIRFFQKRRAKGGMTLGEALRLGLGQESEAAGLPITSIEGEGWLGELLAQLSGGMQISTIEPPPTLQGQLRPYQLKGVSWLAFLSRFGFGACLADDMGLGKGIQFITLLLLNRVKLEYSPNPALLICPMSIVGNWQREIQRFAPSLSAMIHHGHERLSGQTFEEEARKHDVVITTYALAQRDREHLAPIEWEYVVLDEAQNIKNESAKQTQAIKSLRARHRVALTGTPVENRLSELWSIMEFLNPGYLGSARDFRASFALPIERYRNQERAETLRRLIQPFVLRRLKTDKSIIADLPEKLEMKVFCNLTQEQASLYEAVVKEMLEQIEESEGIERKGLILSTLLKLKQICNHPAQFMADGSSLPGRSGKLARLEEMLEEALEVGDKALIFTQFAEMGSLLRVYLQERLGCEVFFLHGGTPKKQRDLMVRRFQEERRAAPLFILSLKAGGVGLNLTAANHVFHFDRWWNPAVEDQATDRAFRIGQTRNVQVHKFLCAGTLEERIDLLIEQKKYLSRSIIGSGEGWLTEMSTDQLKELFALSREAVGE